MKTKQFQLALLIVRGQPWHNAHQGLHKQCLDIAEQTGVIIGSSFCARDPKNTFKWTERRDMITATLSEADLNRTAFIPMRDYHDTNRWVQEVKAAVKAQFPDAKNIALVGHFKDASSFYLSKFPGWTLIEQKTALEEGLSATLIREYYFSEEASWPVIKTMLKPLVPAGVLEYLSLWRLKPEYAELKQEHSDLKAERAKWSGTPHPSKFITVDAVVRCNDHILLVQRAKSPGKGLWALPGGHLEEDEWLIQGALRELSEETSLDIMGYNLEAALTAVTVFEDPQRSLRGRTITHAHYFDMGERRLLPEVKAKSDAKFVDWIHISRLPSLAESAFEDHATIWAARPEGRPVGLPQD